MPTNNLIYDELSLPAYQQALKNRKRHEIQRPDRPGFQPAAALRSGVESFKGSLRGAVSALSRTVGLDSVAEANDKARAINEARAAYYAPDLQSLSQVEDAGDVLALGGNMLLSNAPLIASTVASGGVGGIAARTVAGGLRGARALQTFKNVGRAGEEVLKLKPAVDMSRGLIPASRGAQLTTGGGEKLSRLQALGRMDEITKPAIASQAKANLAAIQKAGRMGEYAGAFLPYSAASTGENYARLMNDPDATGTDWQKSAASLAGGTAQAAAGVLPITGAVRGAMGIATRGAGEVAKKSVPRLMAKTAAGEAITETGEQMIQRGIHGQFNEDVKMFDRDAMAEYADAAFGGAFVGGGLAGVAGGTAALANRAGREAIDKTKEGVDRVRKGAKPTAEKLAQRAKEYKERYGATEGAPNTGRWRTMRQEYEEYKQRKADEAGKEDRPAPARVINMEDPADAELVAQLRAMQDDDAEAAMAEQGTINPYEEMDTESAIRVAARNDALEQGIDNSAHYMTTQEGLPFTTEYKRNTLQSILETVEDPDKQESLIRQMAESIASTSKSIPEEAKWMASEDPRTFLQEYGEIPTVEEFAASVASTSPHHTIEVVDGLEYYRNLARSKGYTSPSEQAAFIKSEALRFANKQAASRDGMTGADLIREAGSVTNYLKQNTAVVRATPDEALPLEYELQAWEIADTKSEFPMLRFGKKEGVAQNRFIPVRANNIAAPSPKQRGRQDAYIDAVNTTNKFLKRTSQEMPDNAPLEDRIGHAFFTGLTSVLMNQPMDVSFAEDGSKNMLSIAPDTVIYASKDGKTELRFGDVAAWYRANGTAGSRATREFFRKHQQLWALKSEGEKLRPRVADQEAELKSLQQQKQTLESRKGAHGKLDTAIAKKLKGLNEKIAAQQTRVNTYRARFANLTAKYKTMRADLSGLTPPDSQMQDILADAAERRASGATSYQEGGTVTRDVRHGDSTATAFSTEFGAQEMGQMERNEPIYEDIAPRTLAEMTGQYGEKDVRGAERRRQEKDWKPRIPKGMTHKQVQANMKRLRKDIKGLMERIAQSPEEAKRVRAELQEAGMDTNFFLPYENLNQAYGVKGGPKYEGAQMLPGGLERTITRAIDYYLLDVYGEGNVQVFSPEQVRKYQAVEELLLSDLPALKDWSGLSGPAQKALLAKLREAGIKKIGTVEEVLKELAIMSAEGPGSLFESKPQLPIPTAHGEISIADEITFGYMLADEMLGRTREALKEPSAQGELDLTDTLPTIVPRWSPAVDLPNVASSRELQNYWQRITGQDRIPTQPASESLTPRDKFLRNIAQPQNFPQTMEQLELVGHADAQIELTEFQIKKGQRLLRRISGLAKAIKDTAGKAQFDQEAVKSLIREYIATRNQFLQTEASEQLIEAMKKRGAVARHSIKAVEKAHPELFPAPPADAEQWSVEAASIMQLREMSANIPNIEETETGIPAQWDQTTPQPASPQARPLPTRRERARARTPQAETPAQHPIRTAIMQVLRETRAQETPSAAVIEQLEKLANSQLTDKQLAKAVKNLSETQSFDSRARHPSFSRYTFFPNMFSVQQAIDRVQAIAEQIERRQSEDAPRPNISDGGARATDSESVDSLRTQYEAAKEAIRNTGTRDRADVQKRKAKYQQVVDRIVNMLGLPPLKVISGREIVTLFDQAIENIGTSDPQKLKDYYAAAINFSKNLNGAMFLPTELQGVVQGNIMMNFSQNSVPMQVEYLLHEIGHAVFESAIANNQEAYDALEIAHDVYLDTLKQNGEITERLHSLYRQGALQARKTLESGAKSPLTNASVETMEWWNKFEEWFSDQFSRWVQDPSSLDAEGKQVRSVLARLFENVLDAFRKALAVLRDAGIDPSPSRTVQDVLNGMVRARAESKAQHRFHTKYIRQLGPRTRSSNVDPETYAQNGVGDFLRQLNKKLMDLDTEDVPHILSALGQLMNESTLTVQGMLSVGDLLNRLLKNHEKAILGRAAMSNPVRRQMVRLFKDHPEFQPLLEDPRTAGALAYILHMGGVLDLGSQAVNLSDRITNKFDNLLRNTIDLNTENTLLDAVVTGLATELIADREDGSGIYNVPTSKYGQRMPQAVKAVMKIMDAIDRVNSKVLGGVRERLVETGNPVLMHLADLGYTASSAVNPVRGYRQAINAKETELWDVFYDYAFRDYKEWLEDPALQEKFINSFYVPDPEVPEALKEGWDKGMAYVLNYVNSVTDENGNRLVAVPKRSGRYVPMVLDNEQLLTRKQDFINLLAQEKYTADLKNLYPDMSIEAAAEELYEGMVEGMGYNDDVMYRGKDGTPAYRFMNRRVLGFILSNPASTEQDKLMLRSFAQKDLGSVLMTYLSQTARRAEYARRFQKMGEDAQGNPIPVSKIPDMLAAADEFTSDPAERERNRALAKEYMQSILGIKGVDTKAGLDSLISKLPLPAKVRQALTKGGVINPHIRNAMGWMIVYQNWRLLGLSSLTQFADLMGIATRSGQLGMTGRGIKSAWKATRAGRRGDHSALLSVAKALGTIDRRMIADILANRYTGPSQNESQRVLNDTLFRLNGLEQLTQFSRLAATASAIEFLRYHSRMPSVFSRDYMEELGLRDGDIIFDEGYTYAGDTRIAEPEAMIKILNIAEREAASPEELARDDRVRFAIQQFVDTSIIRPDPAQRPGYMNDPHFMLAGHLRSYMWAFYETIFKRGMTRLAEGDMRPIANMIWYLPVMFMSDVIRDEIQMAFSDDDDPPWKQGWSMWDHLMYSAEHAGFYGPYQIYMDIKDNLDRSGTGVSQAFSATGSWVEQLAKGNMTLERSLPLQNVWKEWVDMGGVDTEGAIYKGMDPMNLPGM